MNNNNIICEILILYFVKFSMVNFCWKLKEIGKIEKWKKIYTMVQKVLFHWF